MIIPIVISKETEEALNEACFDAIMETPLWVFKTIAAIQAILCGWMIYTVVERFY